MLACLAAADLVALFDSCGLCIGVWVCVLCVDFRLKGILLCVVGCPVILCCVFLYFCFALGVLWDALFLCLGFVRVAVELHCCIRFG